MNVLLRYKKECLSDTKPKKGKLKAMYIKDKTNMDLGFTHFPLVNRVDNNALSCLSEYWAEN